MNITSQPAQIQVTVVSPAAVAAVVRSPAAISAALAVGQGPAGPSGAVVTYTAAQALSGHTAVAVDPAGNAEPADCMTARHAGAVVGVTLDAAAALAPVAVRRLDVIEHSGWAFEPDAPVLVGAGGSLVQSLPPGATWTQVIGKALSATRVFLTLQSPIFVE